MKSNAGKITVLLILFAFFVGGTMMAKSFIVSVEAAAQRLEEKMSIIYDYEGGM